MSAAEAVLERMDRTAMVTALGVTAAPELAVLRALERAGNRMFPRSERARLKGVPPWEIYIHLPADPSRLDELLTAAWELPAVAGFSEELISALDAYTRTLLVSGHAFDRDDLQRVLARL
ncbi:MULTISPECIES: hypothetical protein [Streptomyces]|uniref:hypothetical protein n=1 Tax=Streptomyces TaxID=1883 RepID=UPI002251BBB9|nr:MULTISPECIES: hypothetical protein [Streptomyces]MCX4808882.1 hypothetical protein [Streptomyces sp. NBC_01214]WSJ27796.1 hypothetical protein OG479_00010 [Streptomyces subrutilus]